MAALHVDDEPERQEPCLMSHRKYKPVSSLDAAAHRAMVRDIFATITGTYDFLNRLFSFRRDVAWRRAAAEKGWFGKTGRYLDIATGTGDLALAVARRHGEVFVTAVDFVGEMVTVAAEKIREKTPGSRMALVRADAMALPFPDASFDTAGIAFGIRNMPDRPGALREALRILVPGGRIVILEMHFPDMKIFRDFYEFYLGRVLPRIARSFSRNPEAYHYLADSIMHFPAPKGFIRILEEAGFSHVRCHALTFGITCLYTAVKAS